VLQAKNLPIASMGKTFNRLKKISIAPFHLTCPEGCSPNSHGPPAEHLLLLRGHQPRGSRWAEMEEVMLQTRHVG
jgi:hypothetical protein